jgi:hypothetical protein
MADRAAAAYRGNGENGFFRRTNGAPRWLPVVLGNLMPLAAALFFDWGAFDVVFLYWLENAVIGLFNILKMAFAQPDITTMGEDVRAPERSPTTVGCMKFFVIPFFLAHYSLFMFVHLMFILLMLGGMRDLGMSGAVASAMSPSLILALVLLGIEYGYLFYNEYWKGGGYKRSHPVVQMFAPYQRIVVMHLAILFGGFLFVLFSLPRFTAFLLVGLKVALELVQLRVAPGIVSGPRA